MSSAPALASRPRRVYFFATCVVDLMAPQAGLDAIALIRAAGIAVDFPPDQTCCGQPAYTSGYTEQARQTARAQLDLFPEPWPIVLPSGSCAGMLVHHWPRLFADEPALAARAREIAARVVEWSHFARDVLGLADAATRPAPHGRSAAPTAPVKVALHTSCSARREMGCHLPHEALLRDLPGVELVQQARVAECCGFGGTFSVKFGEVSAAIAGRKCDNIRASGAAAVVGGDLGCLLNIEGRLRREGDDTTRVLHVAEVLAGDA